MAATGSVATRTLEALRDAGDAAGVADDHTLLQLCCGVLGERGLGGFPERPLKLRPSFCKLK